MCLVAYFYYRIGTPGGPFGPVIDPDDIPYEWRDVARPAPTLPAAGVVSQDANVDLAVDPINYSDGDDSDSL
jgi:hypothetical protein